MNALSPLKISAFCIACLMSLASFTMGDTGPTSSVPTAQVAGGEFREGFREQLSVSSSIILGLALGSEVGTGIGSLRQVIVDKSGMPDATTFCLRAMSVDGLFWAENSYVHSSAADFVRTEPLSRKHESELDGYGVDKILVTAGFGSDTKNASCGDGNLIYAPVVEEANQPYDQLTIYINSENRPTNLTLQTISPEGLSKQSAPGKCSKAPVDTAAIYDKTCLVKLDTIDATGPAELIFTFSAGPFGTDTWVEKVILPTKSNPTVP